jgi:hypothetical protein
MQPVKSASALGMRRSHDAGRLNRDIPAAALCLTTGMARAHLTVMTFCAAHVVMKNRACFGAGDVRAR